MYNIKQAAARAGVSVPVLRAWERRYGIVHPVRTASNYRQFDDEAVARVQAMRTMVEAGWAPSTAAAAILAGEMPEPAVATTRAVAAAVTDDDALGYGRREMLGERLVRAAADLDASAVDQILDELFASGSFERVASGLLFPVLERLGEAWVSGQVSIAGEHLVSAAVHRRLAMALEAAGAPLPGRPIIVGLPPGGRHELGALAFAVAARRAGMPVAYLGADLPADDWVTAAHDASAAVIGVVTARDRAAAQQVADRLHADKPSFFIAAGGRAARPDDGIEVLPGALADAVAAVRDRIASEDQRRVAAS